MSGQNTELFLSKKIIPQKLRTTMNTIFGIFLTTLTLTDLHGSVFGLNVEEIVDICPGNFITQDFNSSWENQVYRAPLTVYYPLASKYNAYVLTQYLYQSWDFNVLTESQLEHSCLMTRMEDGWKFQNLTGYDKSIPVQMQPTNVPKLYRFNLPIAGGAGFISGYASVALSDNSNYIVYDVCYDSGLRSFFVASMKPYLDDVSLAVITTHLKAIGFKEKNFVKLNYQDCVDANGDGVSYSAELPVPAPVNDPQILTIDLHGSNYLYPFLFYKK